MNKNYLSIRPQNDYGLSSPLPKSFSKIIAKLAKSSRKESRVSFSPHK